MTTLRVLVAEESTRKLAALLHADMVGSTALVQTNETVAHQRIQDTLRRFAETIAAHETATLIKSMCTRALSSALKHHAETTFDPCPFECRLDNRCAVTLALVIGMRYDVLYEAVLETFPEKIRCRDERARGDNPTIFT